MPRRVSCGSWGLRTSTDDDHVKFVKWIDRAAAGASTRSRLRDLCKVGNVSRSAGLVLAREIEAEDEQEHAEDVPSTGMGWGSVTMLTIYISFSTFDKSIRLVNLLRLFMHCPNGGLCHERSASASCSGSSSSTTSSTQKTSPCFSNDRAPLAATAAATACCRGRWSCACRGPAQSPCAGRTRSRWRSAGARCPGRR